MIQKIAFAFLLAAFAFSSAKATGTNIPENTVIPIAGSGYTENAKNKSMQLVYKGKRIPYSTFALFAMPGESMKFSVNGTGLHHIKMHDGGEILQINSNTYIMNAPEEHGVYRVQINSNDYTESIDLNVVVMIPKTEVKNGWLNGYRIGSYPGTPLNNNPAYLPPEGFIELTPENFNLRVSPHFTLGQFMCKQEGDFPKYIVLQERLIIELEEILETLNNRGYRANTLTIMSGYRTPYYNARIGNCRYSRHQWGDAADIFLDTRSPHGWMDDLNGDGVVDVKDAMILKEIVEKLRGSTTDRPRVGGIGLYDARPWRGPFIHVDLRGNRARW